VGDNPVQERPETCPESEDDQKKKGHDDQVGPDDLLIYFLCIGEYIETKTCDKGQKTDQGAFRVPTERPEQRPG